MRKVKTKYFHIRYLGHIAKDSLIPFLENILTLSKKPTSLDELCVGEVGYITFKIGIDRSFEKIIRIT